MSRTDVVILGAGIAGLATAYELSRRGVSFVVLERAPRPGGVIVSEELDGYTIDGGPDALLAHKPDGIQLCRELGLEDRLISTTPPRLAFIQRRGRLHALPPDSMLGIPTRISPMLRTKLFSWPGKLRMGAELFVRRRTDSGDESIGAFMRRRFGREATDYLAEPLLAGIHAGDVDRLSLHALFPRFAEAELTHGSLLRAFRSAARRKTSRHGGKTRSAKASPEQSEGPFKSLPGGLSEMVRALVRTIGDTNVRTEATAMSIDGRGPFVVQTSGRQTFEARAVVIATPAYVAADLLRERDPDLAVRCREIPYTSTATVALAFRRDAIRHRLNGSGFLVPRAESSNILAVSWLSSKWANRAPDGRVLMRAFLGGARDPHALKHSDAELVDRSLGALRPLLGIAGDPLLTRVYRWDRANAQYEVGHLERVAAIDKALQRHPGIFVTGSGFHGVGIPDCVADGRLTARRVADWLRSMQHASEAVATGAVRGC